MSKKPDLDDLNGLEDAAGPYDYIRRPECLKRCALITIQIDHIDSHELQPKNRTKDVRNLAESISEFNFIVPPLVTPKQNGKYQYVALDGHRRLECARIFGIRELMCVVMYEISPDEYGEAFIRANTSKSVDGNQRAEVWRNAKTPEKREALLKSMQPNHRNQITKLIEKIGVKEMERYVDAGAATASLASNIGKVERWCLVFNLEQPPARQIAEWITKNKFLRVIDTMNRHSTESTAAKVVECILTGRPWAGKRQ